MYHIGALFGAYTNSRQTAFWEIIKIAGAPVLYILQSIIYITVNFRYAYIRVEAHVHL